MSLSREWLLYSRARLRMIWRIHKSLLREWLLYYLQMSLIMSLIRIRIIQIRLFCAWFDAFAWVSRTFLGAFEGSFFPRMICWKKTSVIVKSCANKPTQRSPPIMSLILIQMGQIMRKRAWFDWFVCVWGTWFDLLKMTQKSFPQKTHVQKVMSLSNQVPHIHTNKSNHAHKSPIIQHSLPPKSPIIQKSFPPKSPCAWFDSFVRVWGTWSCAKEPILQSANHAQKCP